MVRASKKYKLNNMSIRQVLDEVISILAYSDYSNIFVFKGGNCIASMVNELNLPIQARYTTDIDLHWRGYSKVLWENFVTDVAGLLTVKSKLGLSYKLTGRRGIRNNSNGDSLCIQVLNKGIPIYELDIDMNFSDKKIGVQKYKTITNRVNYIGYNDYTILADKLRVLTQRKICRRIKDLYDVYLYSFRKDISSKELINMILLKWENSELGVIFLLEAKNIGDMEHSYNKYDFNYSNPSFNIVYTRVVKFAAPIFSMVKHKQYMDVKWNTERECWV